jgi:hypothetical protein
MDESEKDDTLVIATYDVDITARADADVVRDGESIDKPLAIEITAAIEAALALGWPNFTFRVRTEITSN